MFGLRPAGCSGRKVEFLAQDPVEHFGGCEAAEHADLPRCLSGRVAPFRMAIGCSLDNHCGHHIREVGRRHRFPGKCEHIGTGLVVMRQLRIRLNGVLFKAAARVGRLNERDTDVEGPRFVVK